MQKIFMLLVILALAGCTFGGNINAGGGLNGVGIGIGVGTGIRF